VVPILLFVSILGESRGGAIGASLALAVAQAVLAICLIVAVGRLLLRPLFRLVASTGTSEPVVAATLFVIVRAAVVAHLCQPGPAFHGAWRLRRRLAAGGNRVPQGDRGNNRTLQRPAAGGVLLYRRHDPRFPRTRA